MTVSKSRYLKTMYSATEAMGYKSVSSDFTLVINGYEEMEFLCSQAPYPDLTVQDAIEVPMPLGISRWQPSQVKVNQEGAITFMETMRGHVSSMLLSIIADGGSFDCTIFEGTSTNYLRKRNLWDCSLKLDNPDRNWDDRTQILKFSGTIYYHYFGEVFEGNSKDYRTGNTSSRAVGNGGPTPASKFAMGAELVPPTHANQYVAV
jgi:hypothetical protein